MTYFDRCLRFAAPLVAALALTAGGSTAWSQADVGAEAAVAVDGVDSATRAHLERIGAFLDNRQWDEAVESLCQLTEDRDERLIAAPADGPSEYRTYLPLRDYCQWRLCTLPAEQREALTLYRRRVDPLARLWFEQAVAGRDEALLRQVVDELLASSFGDDALWALGEMALSAGNFNKARHCWQRIHRSLRFGGAGPKAGQPIYLALWETDLAAEWPQLETVLRDGDAAPPWPVCPDTDLPLAEVRARLVLVSILAGDLQRAAIELDVFGRLHGDATGRLGGRTVALADALARLLDASRQWPTPSAADDWTTFAGNVRRNAVAAAPIDVALRPVWSVALKPAALLDRATQRQFGLPAARVAESHDQPLAFHPVVVDGLVAVAEQQRIRAFDLASGEPAWEGADDGEIYRTPRDAAAGDRPLGALFGVPRHTLTIEGSRLLARVGSPVTGQVAGVQSPHSDGFLIGLDLAAEGRLLPGFPLRVDDPKWAFDGVPVTDGKRLYVAMRFADVRPHAHVACFDLRNGRPIWRRRVCSGETLARGQVPEVTHNLLTLDHDTLYFNTNLGGVAALSTDDGHVRWVTLYPRASMSAPARGERRVHRLRDTTPCVLHHDMLLVAPSDCEQLFALDVATGGLLWQTQLATDTLDVVHLLGVVGDHLIAAGRRLWWIDVRTGQPSRRVEVNPFPRSPNAEVASFGRGTIAGEYVYWPARGEHDEIYVFDGRTGRQVRQPINLTQADAAAGNLVIAHGRLIVAASDRMYVFE